MPFHRTSNQSDFLGAVHGGPDDDCLDQRMLGAGLEHSGARINLDLKSIRAAINRVEAEAKATLEAESHARADARARALAENQRVDAAHRDIDDPVARNAAMVAPAVTDQIQSEQRARRLAATQRVLAATRLTRSVEQRDAAGLFAAPAPGPAPAPAPVPPDAVCDRGIPNFGSVQTGTAQPVVVEAVARGPGGVASTRAAAEQRAIAALESRLQAELELQDAALRREHSETLASSAARARCDAEEQIRLVCENRVQAERRLQSAAMARVEAEQHADEQACARMVLENQAMQEARMRASAECRQAEILHAQSAADHLAQQTAQAEAVALQAALDMTEQETALCQRRTDAALVRAQDAQLLTQLEQQRAEAEQRTWQAIQERLLVERAAAEAVANSLQAAQERLASEQAIERNVGARLQLEEEQLATLRVQEQLEQDLCAAREAEAGARLRMSAELAKRTELQRSAAQTALDLAHESVQLTRAERARVVAEQEALAAVLAKLRGEQSVCAAAQARADADRQYARTMQERETRETELRIAADERAYAEAQRNLQLAQQTAIEHKGAAEATQAALADAERAALVVAALELAEEQRAAAEQQRAGSQDDALKAIQDKQRVSLLREHTNRLVAQAMQEKTRLEQEELSLAKTQLHVVQGLRDEITRATTARRAQLQLVQQRRHAAATLAANEELRLTQQRADAVTPMPTSLVTSEIAIASHLLAQQLIDRLTRNGGDPAEWRVRAAAILAEADTHVALDQRPRSAPRRRLGSITSVIAGVVLVAGCSVATALRWQTTSFKALAKPRTESVVLASPACKHRTSIELSHDCRNSAARS